MYSRDYTVYTHAIIQGFKVPPTDALKLFANVPRVSQTKNIGIAISIDQKNQFYPNIFVFWVRALYCISEDTGDYDLLWNFKEHISCYSIEPIKFRQSLLGLSAEVNATSLLNGTESLFSSGIKLDSLSYSDSFILLNHPALQSAAAIADGEYLAYFNRTIENNE